MKNSILIGLSLIALTACDRAPIRTASADAHKDIGFMQADQAEAVTVQSGDLSAKRRASPNHNSPTQDSYNQAGVFLAYRYGYGLSMPANSIKSTVDKHMGICRNIGTAKCQITGSNTTSYSKDNIRATLSLRAEPDWLIGFVSQMKSDVAEINGKIDNENISVEDLTRSILDTDARLKSKRSLRRRLENLIETRDAKLPDLLSLERELARVQGEIESATANLKALRARVSMSIVTINYSSKHKAVSHSSISPIKSALKDFVSVISNGVAGVIYVFAYMLPWFIFLILPGVFVGRWMWRRRKTRPAATSVQTEKSTT